MSSGFLWLAASTGLISLLTPCVFPMVPVTIAYFSGEHRRADGARTAILFGLGIISTFTILGLVLAALFGASGLNRFAADPRVNLALAVLFLVFAANLFGWFELNVPWRLLTAADRLTRNAGQGSSLGALIMGATFTLTSVTCTAPFVGTLLVLAATGSWMAPVVGMIVYSTAFALPFVLLAFVPRVVANLPRAGDWMRTLRVLIGLLEVAAAVKFISNADLVLRWGIFTREVVLVIWTVLALSGAGYLALHKAGTADRRGPAAPASDGVQVPSWPASPDCPAARKTHEPLHLRRNGRCTSRSRAPLRAGNPHPSSLPGSATASVPRRAMSDPSTSGA